jgi:hypothetical protein
VVNIREGCERSELRGEASGASRAETVVNIREA